MSGSDDWGEQTRKRPIGGAIVAVSALVALLVLVLLFPTSGNSALPPTCYSFIGYEVPCHRLVAPAAAGGAGLVTVILLAAMRSRD